MIITRSPCRQNTERCALIYPHAVHGVCVVWTLIVARSIRGFICGREYDALARLCCVKQISRHSSPHAYAMTTNTLLQSVTIPLRRIHVWLKVSKVLIVIEVSARHQVLFAPP